MMTQLKALSILDRYIYKARRVNKPYQAIKKTENYQDFQKMFTDAIKKQADWVSDNLNSLTESAGISDDMQPLGLDQVQKLKGILKRDMPALDSFVTEFITFQSLKEFFEWSAKQQYKRWGYLVKAAPTFQLTNPKYIGQLQNRAAYLLNQSSLDQTTIDELIDTITEARSDAMTIDEVSQIISDQFDEISQSRGDMIARTESANSLGSANYATAVENGVTTKSWVTAGSNPCITCIGNEDDGEIPIGQEFSSGDMHEPAHPNDECYTEGGEIDLDTVDLWTGE